MKFKLLALAVVMFAGLSAAQTQDSAVQPDPGLVKAGGFAYGVDVAVDNAMVALGMRSAGDVAFERASEVAVAEERNNTEALERASQRFNQAVEQADNRNRDRLQQAEQVLQNVSKRVPEEAQFGINTALENVERAKQRVPDEFTAPGNGSGPLPHIKLPGGPDQEVDVPGDDQQGR